MYYDSENQVVGQKGPHLKERSMKNGIRFDQKPVSSLRSGHAGKDHASNFFSVLKVESMTNPHRYAVCASETPRYYYWFLPSSLANHYCRKCCHSGSLSSVIDNATLRRYRGPCCSGGRGRKNYFRVLSPTTVLLLMK